MTFADFLLQQAANGIVAGMGYALVALGLTLLFGVMDVINFAHGEFYTLCAYLLFTMGQQLGAGYAGAAVLAIAATALAGALVQHLAVRPVLSREPLNVMLVTFGVGLLVMNLLQAIYSPTPRAVETPFDRIVHVGPVFLTTQKLLVVGVGVLAFAGLHLLIMRTTLGRMMRATAQETTAARLVGIRVERIHIVVFALSAGLAGLAGVLLGPTTNIYPTMGQFVVVKGFVVVILGGMGNIYGAAAGGLVLGLAEALAASVMPGEWTGVIGFSILILTLLFRPQGLLNVSGRSRL
jgi:branched-chain amino acid transport system permease protein